MKQAKAFVGAVLIGCSYNTMAFDLNGMLQQAKGGMEQLQQGSLSPQASPQQPQSTPVTSQQVVTTPPPTNPTQQPSGLNYQQEQERRMASQVQEIPRKIKEAGQAESAKLNTVELERRKQEGRYHSDEDCAGANQILPESIKKLSQIKISGVSIGPERCTSQKTLDRCYSGFCRELGDGSYMSWKGMDTAQYGKIIWSITFWSKKIPERKGITAFHSDDAIYKSLVARYGTPVNVKTEKEPYSKLIWATGAFNFLAWLEDEQLAIKIELENLAPLLRQSLSKAEAEQKQAELNVARNAVRTSEVPKF